MALLLAFAAAPGVGGSSCLAQSAPGDESSKKADWEGYVGGGLALAPIFEGSRRMSLQVVPMADLTWKDRVFLNNDNGLGVWALRANGFRLGPSIDYSEGRNNNGPAHGLGKIAIAPVAKLAAAYRTDFGEFTADAGRTLGGDNGLTVNLGYALRIALADKLAIEGSVGTTWANRRYMQAYFGVNQNQATGSGLPVTTARAGFKDIEGGVALHFQPVEHGFIRLEAGIERLLGDAAASPVTHRHWQPVFAVGAGYQF